MGLNRRGVVVAVALVSLVLAGCVPTVETAGPTPSASPSSSPSPTPTVSATPTPSPTPTAMPAPPDADELILTTTGFAPLPLGVNPESLDPATSVIEKEILDCGDGNPLTAWYALGDRENRPFRVGLDANGLLAAIQVYDSPIRTAVGIHTGSSRAELEQAYPGITVELSDDRTDVYTARDSTGWIRFSVAHNRGYGYWTDAEVETVWEMMAARAEYTVRAPSFHPIDSYCV